MTLTYAASTNDRQPYGSYRIDVYSQKAGRRMTLFGKDALCQFIDLEADFEVTDVCERPLVIPNTKPGRVVDFWAMAGGVATFYILTRPSEQKKRDSEETAFGQFHKWANDNKAIVKAIYPEDFEKRRIRYDNWSSILQHLITHRGQVTDSVIERCAEAIPATVTLRVIENSVTELDAMLVRAAVFTLLARGNLQCDSLDTIPLNPNTKMTRV